MKFYKLIFFISTLFGIFITISAYSWFSMWMGLEINLLFFIPVMVNKKSILSVESSFKYFIIQAMASSVFLLSVILNLKMFEQIFSQFDNIISLVFYSSILIKMGASPFHAWFPEVLEGLSWKSCLFMMTTQKIAPMIILLQNFKMMYWIIFSIVTSAIISGILNMNQTSLRKILAYSSINHIAWMISSMLSTKMIWLVYFIIYAMISLIVIWYLSLIKATHIFQMNFYKNTKDLGFIFNFFSLGGLPPFLGFFPKWILINHLCKSSDFLLASILVISALFSMFVYIRMTIASILMNSAVNFYFKPTVNFSKFKFSMFNFLNLSALMSCPLILNFM